MKDQDIRVRLGTPADEEPMIDFAIRGWEENGIRNIDRAKMRAEIIPALYLHQGLVGIIGEQGEPIQATIVLRTGKMWYSDDWLLEERAIFVHPDFRGAKLGRARMLIEFAKKVAADLSIPLLIGVLSNHRTKGKIKLYERQLGQPAGAFFLYGASSGQFAREPESMTEH